MTWRDLPMPDADEIADAIAWLATLPANVVQGYYLDGLSDVDYNAVADDFCERHGRAYARKLRSTSPDVRAVPIICAEADGERWCMYFLPRGVECGRQLDAGSLTSYGIDSALGITETDPLDVALTIHGLQNAGDAMLPTDERWRLWMFHVDHLRGKAALNRRTGRTTP